jgi:hypothetical protein
MGLDMYLTANKFISAYDKKNKGLNEKLKSHFPKMKSFKIEEVKFEVGYWRKANQIHNWFCVNIQNGEDNCKSYYVSEEKLKELLKLCKKVLANKKLAEKLLPTAQGFFFGSYDYDEYYFSDLENTITIIETIFKEVNLEEYDIEYCSSW